MTSPHISPPGIFPNVLKKYCLPEKLRQTARLRMEYPELSLQELAGRCDPPVSKSCINHRIRKLMDLAKGAEEDDAG